MAARHSNFIVKADTAQVMAAIKKFEAIGGNSARAVQVGTNKALPRIKSMASREIRKDVRLKAKYVNDRIDVLKAGRNMQAVIKTPSRGMLMSRYSTDTQIANDTIRWIKAPPTPPRGIRIKIKPTGSTITFNGDKDIQGKPFYLLLRNSRQIGIAGRRRKTGPNEGKFKVYHSPSLSQVFRQLILDGNPHGHRVLDEANKIYEAQVLDAIRYLTTKLRPPADDT